MNFNATKVRKVVSNFEDKEVQAAPVSFENHSPTQANLSAIVLPTKMGDNYNDSIGRQML